MHLLSSHSDTSLSSSEPSLAPPASLSATPSSPAATNDEEVGANEKQLPLSSSSPSSPPFAGAVRIILSLPLKDGEEDDQKKKKKKEEIEFFHDPQATDLEAIVSFAALKLGGVRKELIRLHLGPLPLFARHTSFLREGDVLDVTLSTSSSLPSSIPPTRTSPPMANQSSSLPTRSSPSSSSSEESD